MPWNGITATPGWTYYEKQWLIVGDMYNLYCEWKPNNNFLSWQEYILIVSVKWLKIGHGQLIRRMKLYLNRLLMKVSTSEICFISMGNAVKVFCLYKSKFKKIWWLPKKQPGKTYYKEKVSDNFHTVSAVPINAKKKCFSKKYLHWIKCPACGTVSGLCSVSIMLVHDIDIGTPL